MPELPEVETTMRGLAPAILDNVISNITLNRDNLRIPFPPRFAATLKNKKVTALNRRAKYIIVSMDDAPDLVIHLGMSGSLKILASEETYQAAKHDHVLFDFKDGVRVVYNDPRRFGMIFLMSAGGQGSHKSFKHLGPEPLSEQFDAAYLYQLSRNKTVPIKQFIMDQANVVGVGNIYACEALYSSRINPKKAAGKVSLAKMEILVDEIKEVLSRAIEAGGSSLKDYKKTDGSLGYFQHSFLVYNQEGKPCSNKQCDGIVKRIVQAGRSTFYCPKEQK